MNWSKILNFHTNLIQLNIDLVALVDLEQAWTWRLSCQRNLV